MIPTLRTDRLRLRPLRPCDEADLVTALSDWDVIRWLSGPPFPFGSGDAKAFVDDAIGTGAPVWAITADGDRLGVIGLGEEFGYWLRRDAWGRGLASEAAVAVLDWHFAQGGGVVEAGIDPENARSRRVLEKLRFAPAGTSATHFPSRDAEVMRLMFRLEPAAWAVLRGAPESRRAGA